MLTRTPDAGTVATRAAPPPAPGIGPKLGLTRLELDRATVANYLRAKIEGDAKELAFFAEVSEQTARAAGMRPRGVGTYVVPGDVFRRDMLAGNTGNLVDMQIRGFASALDAASIIGRLPITRLDNLVGDVNITRETVKGTANWLASEGVTQAADVQSTFGQVSLTPKTIAGVVTASRQLLRQTGPAGNAFVERALAVTVAEAVDRAILAGSGTSGQPQGLLNTPSIDTRAGTSFALSDAAAMFKVASGYDASDSVVWVAGVDAAEDLQTRPRTATYGNGFIMDNGRIMGAPVVVSRSVGAQVLAVMPWSQLWFASWGAIEIGADPYTDFSDGKVTIRCLWQIDIGVERAASVAVATALT